MRRLVLKGRLAQLLFNAKGETRGFRRASFLRSRIIGYVWWALQISALTVEKPAPEILRDGTMPGTLQAHPRELFLLPSAPP